MTVAYRSGAAGLAAEQLIGFFVGWPDPPSPERLLRLLTGSARVVVALDGEQVVGFVNALSDGELSAFIPLLEVLPSHQGQGIGSELVRLMLAELGHIYAVDVVCDDDLVAFYERFGLQRLAAMGLRNR